MMQHTTVTDNYYGMTQMKLYCLHFLTGFLSIKNIKTNSLNQIIFIELNLNYYSRSFYYSFSTLLIRKLMLKFGNIVPRLKIATKIRPKMINLLCNS